MRYLIAFTLLLIFLKAQSQQFGATPSMVKWKQINTDTVRIIFPAGLESQAQRASSIIHAMQATHAATIGDSLKKINIVFNPYTSFSNGYVALSPFRSEFYLTAPQNAFGLGAQNWIDNLAVHEYRHVQQYNNFNKGLAKVASVFLGQDGRAIANAAAIPDWFFEGDAVFNETKLSQQGRGKLPLFLNSYKSLYLGQKKYSYMQLRNGSLRNYIPDHYPLGYMLVAYGYEKYGNGFWRNVTDNAARFKPLFYPLQGAIKKQTGISFNQFVSNAFKFYQEQWKAEEPQSVWLTAIEKNNIADYKYPYTAEDGGLIVLKESYKTIPAFYSIKNNVETKIAVRDIAYDDYFSYNNNKIVYAAYAADARWGYKEYSVIKLLDISTNAATSITTKTRYFSPDISHDGNRIVAVELTPEQESKLVLINTKGKVISTFEATKNTLISSPKFSENDEAIFFIERKDDGEMCIQRRQLKDGTTENLVPYSNKIIGFLQVKHDTVLFNASYKGNDQLFAYVANSKSIYELASYATGVYKSTLVNNETIAASVFTADGYRLASFKPQWKKVNFNEGNLTDLYVAKAFNKGGHQFLSSVVTRNFDIKKYRKATGLFNFHSWRPYYDNPEYSFTIYGENVLNTFQSELAYIYNQNEGSIKVGYTGIYGGTYLQPFFNVSETWQRNALYNPSTRVFWNEFNANIGLQLPFNFSGGKQYRNLTLSSAFNTSQVKWTGIAKGALADYTINYLTTRLQYAGQIQKAVQQIFPHWAQTLAIQYKNSIRTYTANQLLINAAMYLPGIGKTHSLVIAAAYQSRDTANQYYFSNNFPFSKGYRAVDFPRMYKVAGNYHFPLAYPDFGVANIVYFLRIRANAFYEYTQTKSLRTGNTFNFSTTGMEIYFDTKWWNQQPVSFGIRYNHLLDHEYTGSTQPNQWEFILPVNLFR